MCIIFKHNSLQIIIEAHKKVVDFLDITLDLRRAIYRPCTKPNSNLTYIHKQSNHPCSIFKSLPKSNHKRLSANSKNAQIFNEASPPPSPPQYTEALKRLDTIKIYNLIGRVLIKTMKRTKRESGKLPCSNNPSTSTFPQMLRKRFLK